MNYLKIILLMAISKDGKIGTDPKHYAGWTTKEDKKLFVSVSKQAGVIIMGNNTFKTLNRALPGRQIIVITRTYQKSEIEGVNYYNGDIGTLLIELANYSPYTEVALCGGAEINSLFAQYITHAVITTVENVTLGDDAIGLFADKERSVELKEECITETKVLTEGVTARWYDFSKN